MNKSTNRRDFLNKSLKIGAFVLIPYSEFTSLNYEELTLSDRGNKEEIVIRRTPLTTEDYLAYPKRFSNWGRWGSDDQFGTLNFINDAVRKAAVDLVKTGTAISCGRAIDTKPAPDNPIPAIFKTEMNENGTQWTEGNITIVIDYLTVVSHGFVTTHIDALNHVHTNDRRMYNGRPISDVKTTGVESDSIDIWKDGIMSRGVYFDIPKLRNVRYVTPDEPVKGWELEDYATKYKIVPKAGDIVIIDCGRVKYYEDNPDASRKQGEKPGIDPSVLEYFYKYDAAVLGCDFDEARFNPIYNSLVPLHAIANPYIGLPTLWSLNLTRLHDKCAGLNRNEFLFIINPLIIPGGTASLVNPVAVF